MKKRRKSNFFEQVYEKVRAVPEGKVATYGHIARSLGSKDARKIGWALHANKDRKTPCHRVVNKEGGLAANFAFGGEKEQRILLEKEGIVFGKKTHVDLQKYGIMDLR